MKKLLAISAMIAEVVFATCVALGSQYVYASGEEKKVCEDKKDKAGKVVTGKDGKPVQVCKTIKVHKKVEGDKVPTK
jgi:hypothetical protein